jgi:hypothetical protein
MIASGGGRDGGRDGVMLAPYGRFLLVPAMLERGEGVAGVMGACGEKWISSLAKDNEGILGPGVGCAMATGGGGDRHVLRPMSSTESSEREETDGR